MVKTEHIVILALLVGFYLMSTGQLQLPSFGGQPPAPGVQVVQTGVGYATATLTANAIDVHTGGIPNVNVEVWEGTQTSGSPRIGMTQCNGKACSVSTTAPTSLDGFYVVGNDNLLAAVAGWTDRGDEYWLRLEKTSWKDKGTPVLSDPSGGDIKLAQEILRNMTGYDSGTEESTVNITIGAGETNENLELKILAPANGCIGNPYISGDVLAITFNTTNASSLPVFKETKPSSSIKSVPAPTNMTGETSVIGGVAHVLPIKAICDRLPGFETSYRFGVRIVSATNQNPTSEDDLTACLWDRTYFKGDDGKWDLGYEKPYVNTPALDIGFDSRTTGSPSACKALAFQ